MNDKDIEILNDYSMIDDITKNTFLSNVDSDVKYYSHYFKKEFDFKWLDIIEDTLKYIDNILKEPKLFIYNSEEVIQIEKSKKVSVESVIHLSQHSNFVSQINNETGEIRPSKILNVTREETMDIYENRFIYTLINKTVEFINKYGNISLIGNTSINNKSLSYNAETKKDDEFINIKLNIESLENNTAAGKEKYKKVTSRIKEVNEMLNSFKNSTLYKTLASLNVPEVKSPIRKTNVILKNPNFQKAEKLWVFLENYNKDIKKETKYLKNFSDDINIKEKLDNIFLMDYFVLLNDSKNNKNPNEEDINLNYLCHSIKNYLGYNTFMDEEKFIKLMRSEYQKVRKHQEKNYKEIRATIEKDLANYETIRSQFNDLLS